MIGQTRLHKNYGPKYCDQPPGEGSTYGKEESDMAENYILFPTTYKGLATEMKRLLDDYQNGRITNNEMVDVMKAWKQNCDFMVDSEGKLSQSLSSYLGKRRIQLATKVLSTI